MGLKHLLSDHVPIYFDYADEKSKSNYRVLFANTGSLIGERGITDNKQHFGDITLVDLEEWSPKLVKPLLKGMVTLIEKNQDVLEEAKTWSNFKKGLEDAKILFSESNPDMTKLYKVLKTLSKKTWFPSEEAARKAGSPPALTETTNDGVAAASTKPQIANATMEEEAPSQAGPTVVGTFKLVSKRKLKFRSWTDFTTDFWEVYSDHTIRAPDYEADIVRSFKNMYLNPATNDVHISFKAKGKDKQEYCFSVKDNGPKLKEFLSYIRATGLVATFNLDKVLEQMEKTTRRRRMAQREFSSRRDSPVMVRLLEEIIAAQDK